MLDISIAKYVIHMLIFLHMYRNEDSNFNNLIGNNEQTHNIVVYNSTYIDTKQCYLKSKTFYLIKLLKSIFNI